MLFENTNSYKTTPLTFTKSADKSLRRLQYSNDALLVGVTLRRVIVGTCDKFQIIKFNNIYAFINLFKLKLI